MIAAHSSTAYQRSKRIRARIGRGAMLPMLLGALIAAYLFSEFKARAGSAPIVRFVLGMFAMIGSLAFLGCPWRALLRLTGGDLNAIVGLVGLTIGITIGVQFLRAGYNLGRSRPTHTAVGWVMPAIMVGLLLLRIFRLKVGENGAVFFSESGPGAMYAPLLVSLVAGLIIGFFAQRSRFCTVGAIRDSILLRENHLLYGVIAFIVAAFITNLALGQFHPGFQTQPVAQTNQWWNFGGMVLAGLAFTLAGGCPGRQLFLTGEGDSDAGVFVVGMIVGAGFAHNFSMASSPAGPAAFGPIMVIVGLMICIIIGLTMREVRT